MTTKIITYAELCAELKLYPEHLDAKVLRATTLYNKKILSFDISELLSKKQVYNPKLKRTCIVRYINFYDKDKFIDAILSLENYKNIHTSRVQKDVWTDDCRYCYKIKGSCRNCNIAKAYPVLFNQCKLKMRVIELVKSIGLPN